MPMLQIILHSRIWQYSFVSKSLAAASGIGFKPVTQNKVSHIQGKEADFGNIKVSVIFLANCHDGKECKCFCTLN